MSALIIGIDEYAHIEGLKGAGADADAMAKFLEENVHVRTQRIVNLRNKQATRTAIFQAFSDLWNNKSIAYGDPILIYFAGHGCEMRRPHGWDTGGEEDIQGICPYDVEMESTRHNFPIPDRTLGAFLNILSQKKGHCITVIFDCCHSASGVRAPGGVLERAAEFKGRLPSEIDMEYLRKFDKAVPLLNPQSRSYVFIAACGAKQKAREENGRGIFTMALLDALRGKDVDKLTFVEFMCRLKKIDDQNPQCEGHLKTRILFSNKLKVGWGVFPVSQVEQTYRVEAGLIHGVDKGSVFDIHETADIASMRNKPLCSLLAEKVYPLYTVATPLSVKMRHTNMGYARHRCSGTALSVYFSREFRVVMGHNDVCRCGCHDFRHEFIVVQNEAQAEFLVDIDQDNVVFSIKVEAVKTHGFCRLPKTIPTAKPERIAPVLCAASQWTRQQSNISAGWIKNIKFEFWSLEKTTNSAGATNVQRKEQIPMINKNTVSLKVKPDNNDFYGLVIQNNTELNLYISIVLFDSEDLVIEPWFSGPIGVNVQGKADPSLPKNQYLNIGFGNGGGTAISFDPPTRGVNVTILKVYFTTVPMDFGWLKQASPFSIVGDRGVRSKAQTQELMMAQDPQGATALITIKQHS